MKTRRVQFFSSSQSNTSAAGGAGGLGGGPLHVRRVGPVLQEGLATTGSRASLFTEDHVEAFSVGNDAVLKLCCFAAAVTTTMIWCDVPERCGGPVARREGEDKRLSTTIVPQCAELGNARVFWVVG